MRRLTLRAPRGMNRENEAVGARNF